MLGKVYITKEEAIEKQSFFVNFDEKGSQYIFIKDFLSEDVDKYDIYNKETKTNVGCYTIKDILEAETLNFYVLKNTNITAY